MTLKNWILHGVHRMNGLASRPDLPQREPHAEPSSAAAGQPAARLSRPARPPGREPTLASAEHLGVYAPLIDAIRDELEHFVASHVRLHLAIADRDRFLLTSIGVDCESSDEARRLLHQFVREFKPEQVKRYLAREVIAGLPNAAAIDLSQFAGMFDAAAAQAAAEAEQAGEYRELLAALRSTPAAAAPAFRVSVVGRWAELDPARAAMPSPVRAAPGTPLSGERCEFDVEDGSGRRRVVLQGVVAGRRYVVGNGEGSDIRVEGTFTSRRHAELWLENGAWWVADAGSTNGVRIEPAGLLQRGPAAPTPVGEAPVRLSNGHRIVLSARADGPAGDYPWLALRPATSPASLVTPIASAAGSPHTPRTAILATRAAPATATTATTQVLPARRDEAAFRLTLAHAAGVRTLALSASSLPVTVGRSRHQTLVVDRSHEGVSGHHLDIVGIDADGATVIVHGDNGVLIDGVRHPAGARVRWPAGQTLVLGDASEAPTACVLELAAGGA
ncbi:MAG: FHA domain-containing protein [Caldimonas sp.]